MTHCGHALRRALGLPPGPRPLPRRRRDPGDSCAQRRQAGELPDTLLLLEHPPVYTRGRRSGARGAAVRRGLLPRARASTSSTPTAAGASPTTAPASSSAIRSWRIDDVGALPAHDGGRDRRRARRAGHRRARAPRGGPRLHRRVGAASARSPRSACTSRAASPRTASPSTSTTTSSRSPGSSPAACPTCR